MNLADFDVLTAEIRAIQGMYPASHAALTNWGAWCRDRCVGPRMARQHLLDQHDGDVEGYGEEDAQIETSAPAKMERPQETYDEKSALILDERIHSAGGLSVEVRRALRVAYVDGGPVEAKWPVYAGCAVPGHLLERLDVALKFVRRFL
jgi:hypothetical protein